MNAATLSLGLTLVLGTMAVACGSSPAGPSESNPPALNQIVTSAHYVIQSSPGDTVDTAWQDGYYEWLLPALQLQSSPPLDYFKYRDRAHLAAVTGRLPALSSLLRSSDFFSVDANVTYPCAGSFVRYLIDTYGLAPLKAYIASSTFDDAPSVTESRFRAAYGRTVDSLWEEWRAEIR